MDNKDIEEYPSDEVLEQIEAMPCDDFHKFMEFVHSHWRFAEWGWKCEGDIYYVSTGGWSGNESLLGAMSENFMFWSLYWQEARRGGPYVFSSLAYPAEKSLPERSEVKHKDLEDDGDKKTQE